MHRVDHYPDVVGIDTWRDAVTQVKHMTVPRTKIIQHSFDSTLNDIWTRIEHSGGQVTLKCHLLTDRVAGNRQ